MEQNSPKVSVQKEKRNSITKWIAGVLGIILGFLIFNDTAFIGIAAILSGLLLIPPIGKRVLEKKVEKDSAVAETKKCPFCSEEIINDAKVCKHCGKRQPVKMSRKGAVGLAIFFIALFVSIIHFGVSTPDTPTSDSTDSSATATSALVSLCANPDSVKSGAQSVSYAELQKSPDTYIGTDAKFTGKILQIQESNGQGYMLLSVTNEGYGVWDNNVYVTYSGHNDFVEGDIVTVYGVLDDSHTYTSQANYQLTVPSLVACTVAQPTGVKPQPASASVTTAPTPTPTPAPAGTWHTALTYSNNVDIKTPPFALQGSKWRITYSCTTNSDAQTEGIAGMFYGNIYSADSGNLANSFASFVTCPKSDTSYAYAQTPGQYYLDLSAPNSSYTVTVEDYY